MLDLGAADKAERPAAVGGPIDPAIDLVERLLGTTAEPGGADASAGQGTPVARAAEEIRRRVTAGETPVGLYRLSEVITPRTVPAPRTPIDEPDAVVEVARRYPCAVLDAADAAGIAQALAGLLTDGRRVVVTGAEPERLTEVRGALPESTRRLCLDGELPLSDAELRELRWLMVTGTPQRQQRLGQVLPEPALVPSVDRVAQLCRAGGGRGYPPREAADLIPELLGGLTPTRLQGLISAAQRFQRALASVDSSTSTGAAGYRDASWARPLLERVLFGSARPGFERLLKRSADIVSSADTLNTAADRMAVVGELPSDAVEQLNRYADYLDGGGKAKVYFRSQQQRAVEPTLAHLQLDGVPMKESRLLRQAVTFIELIEAMGKLRQACQNLDVPAPNDVPSVSELNRRLNRIEESVRAVEALRHEVLFIHPSSPVSIPDLVTAETVAANIVASGGADQMADARTQLGALADGLERSLAEIDAEHRAAPEFERLIEPLRAHNLPDYLDALSTLSAARRQWADQHRLAELMGRLREAAPELASAWDEAEHAVTQGTARFVRLDELLADLPDADTADLVLLLGADQLATPNLLAAAAAPRLLAVGSGFATTPVPAPNASPDTVLSVLRRAGVPVIVAATSTGAHAMNADKPAAATTQSEVRPTEAKPAPPTLVAVSTEPEPKEKKAAPAEEGVAFTVLPLGIVPRQTDRKAAEAAESTGESGRSAH